MTRHFDKDCPACGGTGEACLNEKMMDGEWWCLFGECHCVPNNHDETSKELIHRVVEIMKPKNMKTI
jgi:hypothetical protein